MEIFVVFRLALGGIVWLGTTEQVQRIEQQLRARDK